ncbi:MAG: YwmB family TATA-box binding protein [Bacillota bacterium]
MRRFLFLAFIMFLITSGVLIFSGEYDATVPGNSGNNGNKNNGEPYFLLYRAMEMAEARVHKGELHYWASLKAGDGPLTAAALEAQADTLLQRLAPRFVPTIASTRIETNAIETNTYETVSAASLQGGGADLPEFILVERGGELYHAGRLRLLLQGMEEEGERTVHLFLTIHEEGEAQRLGELARRLPSLLELDARSSSLTFSLTGRIPVEMESDVMERLALEIAGKLGARQVESIREEYMVSVTGYTPLLKKVGGGDTLPVNLNLALRHDDRGGGTIFWAGTPLISGTY